MTSFIFPSRAGKKPTGLSRWAEILAAGLAILLLTGSSALASSARDLSLRDLVRRADRVVKGRVSAVQNRMEPGPGGVAPWTEVAIDVAETLKGSPRSQIRFHMLGGTRPDGTRLIATGAPHFQVGDEVVVMLKEDTTLLMPVVGLRRGQYRLVSLPGEATERVFDSAGKAVTGVDRLARPRLSEAPEQAMRWSDFRSLLRGYAQHP